MPLAPPAPRALSCFAELWRDPRRTILLRWNWKSSLFSSLCRGALFFAMNLTAGLNAAAAAMVLEFVYRSITAGFYGAVTQQFRRAEPRWLASLIVGAGVPAFSHTTEIVIHWLRKTPNLRSSIAASVAFTVVTTLFNLHAMRHGVLVVGDGSRSIGSDLRAVPRTIWTFITSGFGLVALQPSGQEAE